MLMGIGDWGLGIGDWAHFFAKNFSIFKYILKNNFIIII